MLKFVFSYYFLLRSCFVILPHLVVGSGLFADGQPGTITITSPKYYAQENYDPDQTFEFEKHIFTDNVNACFYLFKLLDNVTSFYGSQYSPKLHHVDESLDDVMVRLMGNEARPHLYPWYAMLTVKAATSLCGGVLISKRLVLTAAHCFNLWSDAHEWEVHLGKHATAIPPNFVCEGYSQQTFDVEAIIPHPRFNFNSPRDNDIALVVLPEPGVRFTRYVRPIRMPIKKPTRMKNHRKCVISGVGRMPGECFRWQILPVITTDECRKFACSMADAPLTNNMICGYIQNMRGTCPQYNNGGGYICEEDKLWYVVGVVSFGSATYGDSKLPTVFANVRRLDSFVYEQAPYLKKQLLQP